MNKTFWNSIIGPIVGLSPMDGVTDASMRFVAKKYGQADIIYTEFVSAEGLWRIKKRGDMEHKIWRDLIYSEIERPVIAQLFGSDPESFYEAAKICVELGFDGIDINMGCPSPGLEKRGGGAGLIRDKCNAREVIEATRRGVEDWIATVRNTETRNDEVREIPVSVKTRIGSEAPDSEWWDLLAEMKLPAVAMHGRTFKQLYSGEADWEVLFQAAEVIRASGAKFLGNGDVTQIAVRTAPKPYSDLPGVPGPASVRLLASAPAPAEFAVLLKSGKELDLTGKMDGVLIGREAMGNPWVLRHCESRSAEAISESGIATSPLAPRNDEVSVDERLGVMVEQAKKYEEIFKYSVNRRDSGWIPGQARNDRSGLPPFGLAQGRLVRNDGSRFQFFPMRKHLACFARGFEGSVGLRKKLMTADTAEQVEMMVEEFLSEHNTSVN